MTGPRPAVLGLNDRVWQGLQGRPQTEKAHIVERYRRPDLGHLEVEITIDDPGAYLRPWKVRRILELAPDEEILRVPSATRITRRSTS